MASGRSRKRPDDVAEMVRTLLITQLALAGVPQRNIRTIVGCDMNYVTAVVRHIDLKGRGNMTKGSRER